MVVKQHKEGCCDGNISYLLNGSADIAEKCERYRSQGDVVNEPEERGKAKAS